MKPQYYIPRPILCYRPGNWYRPPEHIYDDDEYYDDPDTPLRCRHCGDDLDDDERRRHETRDPGHFRLAVCDRCLRDEQQENEQTKNEQ